VTIAPETLPDDIAALKRIIAEMARDALAARTEIAKLKFQLARYRRAEFGRSSEKLAREVEQLEGSRRRPADLQPEAAQRPAQAHLPKPREYHSNDNIAVGRVNGATKGVGVPAGPRVLEKTAAQTLAVRSAAGMASWRRHCQCRLELRFRNALDGSLLGCRHARDAVVPRTQLVATGYDHRKARPSINGASEVEDTGILVLCFRNNRPMVFRLHGRFYNARCGRQARS